MSCPYRVQSRGPEDHGGFGIRDYSPDRRQCRNRTVIQCRRTPHHDGFGVTDARHVAHEPAQLAFTFVGDGAGVDNGEIGGGGIVYDDGTLSGEGLAHQLGVVLVRLTAEGVKVDVHGRTVSPSNTVHTRSVRPAPLRSRRSSPKSSRPRPPENCFPIPVESPNSVGALAPGPNASCPPRTPNRTGDVRDPSSVPNDQVNVSCAFSPARPQLRQATAAAIAASVPGRHRTPPPNENGRSLVETVWPPMSARSFVSDRTQAARRR